MVILLLCLRAFLPPKAASFLDNVANLPERSYSYCMVPGQLSKILRQDTTKPMAPLLDGTGNYGMTITTREPDAQLYFNQGLRLYYAFNHMEAYRSFLEAARLDSTCAMCYWGQALSLGPNINAPMETADAAIVATAVQKAKAYSANVTPLEKGFIAAINERYIENPPENRAPLDAAYTKAMQTLHGQFPTDPDVAALCAEAIMDEHPWEYWKKDGSPEKWTPEIVTLLENVIKTHPRHPGAHHFYIHAVEASNAPEQAMGSANLLGSLMPSAGHLVHMPSHIYIRTGKYHAGTLANQASVKADEAYLNACNSQGMYAMAYYPHNYHFLWACATMEGRSALALQAADTLQLRMNRSYMLSPFGFIIQQLYITPVFARVRFGQWDDLLQIPSPDKSWKFALAMWHYGRGIAYARKEMPSEAVSELAAIRDLEKDTTLKDIAVGARNTPYAIMAIAAKTVEAEIAAAKKDYPTAIRELKAGIALEDQLKYNEPIDWHQSLRVILGAVLLKAGDYKAAETCYLEDLKNYRENGWALMGLYQSLKAQGKTKAANTTLKRFNQAFTFTDIKLTSSRI